MVDQKVFDDEKADAKPKRVSNSLQGYDQIIAVSEDAINAILNTRYSSLLKLAKDKRLRSFKHSIPKHGTIDATLGAPRIQFHVPDNADMVRFFLKFATGSLTYWDGEGRDAEEVVQPFRDWTIGFDVSLDMQKLTTVPQEIRDKLSLAHDQSYSASQIILSLSSAAAAKMNWLISSTPGLTPAADTQEVFKTHFEDYMKLYLSWMSKGTFSVLGYAIHAETSDQNVGTAKAPKYVNYRIQEYAPTTTQFQDYHRTSQDNAGLDALIFLQKIEGTTAPNVSDYSPSKAGNWIVGGLPVSLAVSKDVFWNAFILDKLQVVNTQSLTLANNIYHWVYVKTATTSTNNTWIISSKDKPTEASWVNGDTSATYSWSEFKPDNHTWMSGMSKDEITTKINNEIKWTPGGNAISLSIDIFIHKYVWSQEGEVDRQTANFTISLKWSLSITLSTIVDGGLATHIESTTPVLDIEKQANSIWDPPNERSDFKSQGEETIKSGFHSDDFKSSLETLLNTQSKFIFLAGAEFFMSNPVFDNNGDILVELSYKTKDIAIEDIFLLRADNSADTTVHGHWLKVQNDSDDTPAILVADKTQATKFQVDDGDLVVDKASKPEGPRSLVKLTTATKDTCDFVFVTETTFDARLPEPKPKKAAAGADRNKPEFGKLECNTTGSLFVYGWDLSAVGDDSGTEYKPSFTLERERKERVQLYLGSRQHAGDYAPFTFEVVY